MQSSTGCKQTAQTQSEQIKQGVKFLQSWKSDTWTYNVHRYHFLQKVTHILHAAAAHTVQLSKLNKVQYCQYRTSYYRHTIYNIRHCTARITININAVREIGLLATAVHNMYKTQSDKIHAQPWSHMSISWDHFQRMSHMREIILGSTAVFVRRAQIITWTQL